MSKNSDARRNEITKIVLSQGKVRVDELVAILKVTPETIRSDLTFLEQKGILYRTHGGAQSREGVVEIPMDVRLKEMMEIKRQICYQAINYIHDDNTVFIDPSSTAIPLGRLVRLRKNLTIVTNSYELIPIVADSNHKIIVLGGNYSTLGKRMYGSYATDMIKTIFFDVAFFGMDGCKQIDGPATNSQEEIDINQAIMRRSKMNILMADESKFENYSTYQYCKFDAFDILITGKLKSSDRERIHIKTIEVEAKEDI